MSSVPYEKFPNLPAPPLYQIILASGSPRRRELLGRLYGEGGFVVMSADIDESVLPDEAPEVYVSRLAHSKAETIAARLSIQDVAAPPDSRALVIGADTTVALDGTIFGKPADAAEAHSILRALSGGNHQTVTGLAVVEVAFDAQGRAQVERCETGYVVTDVRFRQLDDAEIAWYVGTGEPMDKAGAYGVQGYGSLLIETISGEYYNIVGLPLAELLRLLRRFV